MHSPNRKQADELSFVRLWGRGGEMFLTLYLGSYSCLTYLSSHEKNSLFHTIEFWGLKT